MSVKDERWLKFLGTMLLPLDDDNLTHHDYIHFWKKRRCFHTTYQSFNQVICF